MVSAVFYFILTLLLLVFVHESGHFLVARWCGVKVIRCSFGFGKILGRWRDRHGTEYVFSLFPLGGYVKLLDEDEGPVARDARHQSFNYQPVWTRMAIVIAGPLFNFLFAFLVLWLVAIIGIKSFAPRIDYVKPGSIAAQAQIESMQEIIALDGKKINSWRDVHYVLMPLLGSTRHVPIAVKSLHDASVSIHSLPLAHWAFDTKHSDLLESLGIVPLFPRLPVVIDIVNPKSSAQLAGLLPGDEIVAVDHQTISDWRTLSDYVRARPGAELSIEVSRLGQPYTFLVHLQTNAKDNTGLLGVGAKLPEIPADWLRTEHSGPIAAIGQAWGQTLDFTGMTFLLMGRTVMGKLPFEHLSGPIGIAKAAGEAVQFGYVYYLFFIALLSISIGVLNLLPIPMLDGGRLLYELIELILRRPLSKEFKMRSMFLGIVLVFGLTLVALYNDLT
ncbi:MAG: RIP metalloprotease RseP [Legionellales bacterium]|nr:RIP metalloprotease RseP [Legionellales bacterium]